MEGTGGAFDIEMLIPIPKNVPILNLGYIVTEGSFNSGDPNPWAVRIGYALTWEGLGRAATEAEKEKAATTPAK